MSLCLGVFVVSYGPNLKKLEAHGGRDFFDVIGWGEATGASVDGEGDDVV
jgi:hypothetical protein